MTRKKYGEGADRAGKTNVIRADRVYISVFCRGETENAHDKWRIASFYPEMRGGDVSWAESASGYAEHDTPYLRSVRPRVTQYLVGNEWLSEEQWSWHADSASFRSRWSLKCPKCNLAATVSDPTSRTPVLDRLATLRDVDGILEISLKSFATHVAVRGAVGGVS